VGVTIYGCGCAVAMSLLSLASLPVPGSLIRLLRAFRVIRYAARAAARATVVLDRLAD
jgi:hypothetical protein